uniref:Uncharacterized protein n=1 Tax=Tanacetum cinerariifolium TaxID=118510 RepID=A0A6L2JML4_TANCI|nr:hypothetical protein [Tanacetum cinerariifolium]
MGLLHLKDPIAEAPKAGQLQPSPEQLMLPIHRLEDQVVIEETSLSFSLDVANALVEASTFGLPVTSMTTALSTTFIQASIVPRVSVVDHDASGAGPSTKVPSPSKIVFEKEELETTPEHTAAS